jgi:hypothetical protein
MSRSVDYVSPARYNGHVIYFTFEGEQAEEVQNGFIDVCEEIQDMLSYELKSVYKCNSWDYGRELHTIAQNRMCDFVLSEYCGLFSLSLVPRDGEWGSGSAPAGLCKRWTDSVLKRVQKLMDCYSTRLGMVGRFSNGEALFERATA